MEMLQVSIWTYSDGSLPAEDIQLALTAEECIFCRAPLETLKQEGETHRITNDLSQQDRLHVRACPVCGWWTASRSELTEYSGRVMREASPFERMHSNKVRVTGAAATLKNFDITNDSAPIDEVRDYLA